MAATLTGREKICDSTYALTIEPKNGPIVYKAGQTVDVTFPNLMRPDKTGNRRTFSIADAPSRRGLLVATRFRGSGFKQAMVEAPLGTQLEVDGPYGSFTLPNKPSEVVMLAGGVGITPFRAIAEDAQERSLDHTLSLIHSSRKPEEAPFLEELIRWGVNSANETSGGKKQRRRRDRPGPESQGVGTTSAGAGPTPLADDATAATDSAAASTLTEARRPHFLYVPIMTQAEQSARGWKGERRRVSPELLAEILPAERNRPLYYVAGPPRFVNGAVDSLKTVGVDEDRIRFEEFPGY